MTNQNQTKIDKEQALSMIAKGMSVIDVAAFYGCSRERIYQVMRRAKVKTLPRSAWMLSYPKDDDMKKRRVMATNMVGIARQRGTLVQQPCEICGKPETVAHHDDYSKPLDVRWLCRCCHQSWHRENIPLN